MRVPTTVLVCAAATVLAACGPVAPGGSGGSGATPAGPGATPGASDSMPGAPRATPAGSAPAGPPAAATIAADAPGLTAADFRAGDGKTAAERLADPRYAGADLHRGELLSLACQACHTLRAGEPDNIGPNLAGVFGRDAAARPSFAYSDALRGSGLVWTPAAVEAWLANPQGFLPGTLMAFTGYRSAEDRRDVVAFLLRATSESAAEAEAEQ